MALRWLRRSLRRSKRSAAKKPQSCLLRCEQLEDRVLPDGNPNNLLASWLSIRLYSPASLGASVSPSDPALAAVWQGQNTGLNLGGVAPGAGGLGEAGASDGGNTTPAGGHYLKPGDGGAMPDGELIAPDVTDASALGQLSSDPGMWPSAGYVFLGATFPGMLPPSGGGSGGSGASGNSSWDFTTTTHNPDGTTTTIVSSGSTTSGTSTTNSTGSDGYPSTQTTSSGSSHWDDSTVTTDSQGNVLFSLTDIGGSSFHDVSVTGGSPMSPSMSYTNNSSGNDHQTETTARTLQQSTASVTDTAVVTTNDVTTSSWSLYQSGSSSSSGSGGNGGPGGPGGPGGSGQTGMTITSASDAVADVTQTHQLQATGTAVLTAGGSGTENYGYTENTADSGHSEDVSATSNGSTTTTLTTSGSTSTSASWNDAGSVNRTLPAGSPADTLNAGFTVSAGFNEAYSFAGSGNGTTTTNTLSGGGSASYNAGANGSDTFHAVPATGSLLTGSETFTSGASANAGFSVSQSITTSPMSQILNALSIQETTSQSQNLNTAGSVTLTASDPSNPSGVDNFTDVDSGGDQLTIAVQGGGNNPTTESVAGSGSSRLNDYDAGNETVQSNSTDLGSGPGGGLGGGGAASQGAGNAAGGPTQETSTISDNYTRLTLVASSYTLAETLQQSPPPSGTGGVSPGGGAPVAGSLQPTAFALTQINVNSTGGTDEGTAQVSDTNSYETSTASETFVITFSVGSNQTLAYQGVPGSQTLSVGENTSDNDNESDNGTDSDVEQIIPGLTPGAGGSPGSAGAGSGSAADGSQEQGTEQDSGTFGDTGSDSEVESLLQSFAYTGLSFKLSALTLNVTAKDAFTDQDAGSGTLVASGGGESDNESGTYQDSDSGSDTETDTVTGDSSGLAITTASAVKDAFSNGDSLTDLFTLVSSTDVSGSGSNLGPSTPGASGAGSGSVTDNESGTLGEQDSAGGNETLGVNAAWTYASGKVTLGAWTGSLTMGQTFSDTDTGNATDTETATGENDTANVTLSGTDAGSDNLTVGLTGNGTTVAVTADETDNDTFTDNENDSGTYDETDTIPGDGSGSSLNGPDASSGQSGAQSSSDDVTEHLTGQGSDQEQDSGNASDTLHQTGTLTNDTWTPGTLTATLSVQDSFTESGSGSGNFSDSGSNESDQGTDGYTESDGGTDNTTVNITGSGTSFAVTQTENEADNFSETDTENGTFAATEQVTDDTSGDGVDGPSTTPGGTAADSGTENLTDHLSGNEQEQDNDSGNETLSVTQTGQLNNGSYTPATFTANLTEQDNFSTTDSGSDNDTETGTGVNDTGTDNFTGSDSGTDTEQVTVTMVTPPASPASSSGDNGTGTTQVGSGTGSGTATNQTFNVTLTETEQDNFNESDNGSGSFDDTSNSVAQTGAAPADSSATSGDNTTDHEKGTGTSSDSESGTDTLNLTESAQVTGDTATITSLTADVKETANFSDSDAGQGSDAESTTAAPGGQGTDAPSSASDNSNLNFTYSDGANGTLSDKVHITGSGTSFTATETETEADGFADTENENGDWTDVQAASSTPSSDGADLPSSGSTTGTGSDTDKGNGTLAENDSGSESLALNDVWSIDSTGTATLSSMTATLNVQATSNESDNSTDKTAETGDSTPGQETDNQAESDAESEQEQIQITGSGTTFNVNVTDTLGDKFTTGEAGNGSGQDSTGGQSSTGGGSSSGNTPADSSTPSWTETYNGSDGGNASVNVQQMWAVSNDNWTLTSVTGSGTEADNYNYGDQGTDTATTAGSSGGSSSGQSPSPGFSSSGSAVTDGFSDYDNGSAGETDAVTGNATALNDSRNENISDSFGDSEDDNQFDYSVSGSVTATLHRDLVYPGDSDTATLSDATLNVSGSFSVDGSVDATFTIVVTSNSSGGSSGGTTSTGSAGGFTTTVTETGTNVFANLNVTIDASDGWLDNFVSTIEQDIQSTAQDGNPGNGGASTNQSNNDPSGTTVVHSQGGETRTQTFDASGRPLSDVTTDNTTGAVLQYHANTYDANGNKLSQTDGIGTAAQTTVWTYDDDNHETSETTAFGTAEAATTDFVYVNNQLDEVIDPDGNVTSYAYDSAGNVIRITDSIGDTLSRTFNDQGQLTSETNRNGMVRYFRYDNQGREIGETWYAADGTTVINQVSYTYNSQGLLASAGNDEGTYSFTYDSHGRVIHVDGPFGASFSYAYDANGNRVLVTDCYGGSTASAYDTQGDLISRWFSQDGQPLLGITQTFNADGSLAAQNYQAGDGSVAASSTYGYDIAGDLLYLTQTAGNGAAIASYVYSYDSAGQLSEEIDSGADHVYAYNGSGELISADGVTENYDSNGNRDNTGYIIGPDNHLLSDGVWNYGYDAEGNLVGKTNIQTGESWAYSYDNLDRMIGAAHYAANGTLLLRSTYGYDVFDHMVEESDFDATNGQTTIQRFVYNGDQLYAVLNGSNQLIKRYVLLDAQDSAFARVNSDGTVNFLLTDRLGSLRNIVSSTGAVLDQMNYDAWGNITSETTPSNGDQIGYAGYWYVESTGLYQVWHRWYDPTTGRWLSKDPMSFAAGDSNLYRYVGNDPTDATDPTGMASIRRVNDVRGGNVSLFFVRAWARRRAFSNDYLGSYLGTLNPTTGMVVRGGMSVSLEKVQAAVDDDLWGPVTTEQWNRWFKENSSDALEVFMNGNISGRDGFTSVKSANEALAPTWYDNRQAAGRFAAIGVAIILEWNGSAFSFVSPTSKVKFFFNNGEWRSAEGKLAELAEGQAASAAMKRGSGRITQAAAEIRGMALKGWSKGKGSGHFDKHGIGMGFKNLKEYTEAAKALAARAENVIESKVGNIIFKYEKDTGRILIINAKDRTIKTFYKADNGLQSFRDAMKAHLEVLP